MGARNHSTAALNSLFEQYRRPLLAFLRRRYPQQDAEDWLHGFCLHLLRRNFLANVAPEKGKFRTFLIRCLQHYLQDKQGKRGRPIQLISLDETNQAGEPLHAPVSAQPAADWELDRAWAKGVLAQALDRMKRECANSGHQELWEALEPVLHDDADAGRYAAIGKRLRTTEGAIKTAAHRMRARLRVLIRDEVRRAVGPQADPDEELANLAGLFRAA